MLYAFYGTNEAKAKDKAEDLLASLLKKRPDASLIRLSAETFESSQLPELLAGQGLFVQKYVVVLDRIITSSEAGGVVLPALADIAASENIFILVEGKLDAKTKKTVEKHADKANEYSESPGVKKPERFNAFSLADAFGRRDKKKLWLLYQEALLSGLVAEELHGTLWWQTKSMLLAHKTKSAEEAGMKDFPYQKACGFAQNFSEAELERLAFGLVELYHEARRGKVEFGVGLEKWVLGV